MLATPTRTGSQGRWLDAEIPRLVAARRVVVTGICARALVEVVPYGVQAQHGVAADTSVERGRGRDVLDRDQVRRRWRAIE
jgi:hypothetical protein